MPDFNPPVLVNFSLPKILEIDPSKTGQVVTFQVTATDAEGGIQKVIIELDRFLGASASQHHLAFNAGTASADGQFSTTDTFLDQTPNTANLVHRVGPDTPSGTINVFRVWVIDSNNLLQIYSQAQLQAAGFNTQITIVNPQAPAAPQVTLNVPAAAADARVLEGTAEPGSTIYLAATHDYGMRNFASATTGADGKWHMDVSKLPTGTYARPVVWAVNSKGNASHFADMAGFDIWPEGLSAPQFSVPFGAAGTVPVSHPIVRGVAVPGATVSLFSDGALIGTAKADDAGLWAMLPTSGLSNGRHSLTASQVTANGAKSPTSSVLEVEVTASLEGGIRFPISSFSAVAGVVADQARVQHLLNDLAARFSEVIDGDAIIPIKVTIEQMAGAVAAAAGAGWLGTKGPGGLPALDNAVLLINLPSEALYLKNAPIHAGVPAFLGHELMHVLGFAGLGGNGFDALVKTTNGVPGFYGKNAMAIYGGAPALDQSRSHLINNNNDMMDPGGGSMLSPNFGAASPWAPFSMLDLAILKDLGWHNRYPLVSNDGHTFVPGSGKPGFNQIDGTAQLDTLFVDQARVAFSGSWVNGEYKLVNKLDQSFHDLFSIERITFSDTSVALDINGVGGQAYRIYQAAFARTPDPGGLGFWIKAMDGGASIKTVAQEFMKSAEFIGMYGATTSNTAFIEKLYQNVLRRPGDQGGIDFWVKALDANNADRATVLAQFSESPENQSALATIIGNGFEFLPFG